MMTVASSGCWAFVTAWATRPATIGEEYPPMMEVAVPAAPWLGVIADDYTGATDLAGMIARTGMQVVQYLGVPEKRSARVDADVVVIALKSRSIPAADAVAQSSAAAHWLKDQGVQQLYFKYCSTFDSTDDGNIGPVADALAAICGARSVAFLPASPEHGRTTYLGHLFVGDQLLSDSPLKDHPINPMTDSNLVRVLSRQTDTPVDAVTLDVVVQGPDAVRSRMEEATGRAFRIMDATSDADVRVLAQALADAPLVTGGASLAAALAATRPASAGAARPVVVPAGPALVLAGSCSAATRAQLAEHASAHPVFTIDVYALDRGEDVVGRAREFVRANPGRIPAVVASTDPDQVRRIQSDLGVEHSAALVEQALGEVARIAAAEGFTRILVAGGETSGAVVNSLGVDMLRIGQEVAPGVPWTVTDGERPLGLLLKSGNFGGPHIFRDALRIAG